MITPPYLNPGDIVGLVSPASRIESSAISTATALIKRMGYRVKTGKHALDSRFQFAGSDEVRAADFQAMLDDPEVKMILCTRGGYGMVRIIDRLDFSRFLENPKWIAGYSDITVIHSHLTTLFEIESIHGIMPYNFPECGAVCSAIDRLFQVAGGKKPAYRLPAHDFNVYGRSEGLLVGGNISIITSLTGSVSELETEGRVLFLEEVGERLYRLDRMMHTLKRSGKLNDLAGLIIGGLTEMTDSAEGFGSKADEIVKDAIGEVNYPVCFGFPAGHITDNYPLIIGREVHLEVAEQSAKIDFR